LNTSQETSLTLPPLIRAAVATDLDRLWDIRHANDVAGQIAVPDQDPTPAYLAHLQEHGSLLVAESGGRIVGYAGLVDRGGFAYLTDLFVDPASQSLSIGRQLLEQILPTDSRTTCTLATTDYRAISLYTRAGMAPRWPNLLLEVSVGRLREISLPRIEMFSADPFDPALHRWDHAASGRDRPVDLSFMVHAEQGQPFWFGKGGEIIGYGIIRFNAIRPWRPDTITIGPIGAATAVNARESVLAAVHWARSRGAIIEIAVPGPHPVLGTLLAAGFTITYVETYCASAATLVNPARYVGSGGDLF
jgi:ribosomal protein S18 acetylase RimI-like enzyme